VGLRRERRHGHGRGNRHPDGLQLARRERCGIKPVVLPLLALGLALVGVARTLPDSFRCPAFTLRRRQSAAAPTAEGSLSA